VPHRILVVDDDPATLGVVRAVLTHADYQVATARSGVEAVVQLRDRDTALVLLETQLPDIDGLALVGELRARRYAGPVMFVSAVSSVDVIVAAFQHGADDYLAKPFEPRELLARVAAIMRQRYDRSQPALDATLRVGDAQLDLRALTYSSAAVPPTLLTPTESRLLECLMRHAHIVIGRETLIERVWGYDFPNDRNRVDVYVRRVRAKIEPDPVRPAYLQTVRGLGYVFGPRADAIDATPPSHDESRAGSEPTGPWRTSSAAR
jgi:DNA-binding response OmpR family regulator